MMRQSNLFYASLALVLITISYHSAYAKSGLRWYKDKEDSYFSEHMKPCIVATRRAKSEDSFDRSQCSACNIQLGRTPFERGLFEKRLALCLGGTKSLPNQSDMYQCGSKALCHSYVKSVRECAKNGVCVDADVKSCMENCTAPTNNNCIDEDKSDFQKARFLCATKGAAQYEMLGESHVMRILEQRAAEMYPVGGTTTLPPQSPLAKTSIFSPATDKKEDTVDTITTADEEVKTNIVIPNPAMNSISESQSETTYSPANIFDSTAASARALSSPAVYSTLEALKFIPQSSRVKMPAETNSTAPSLMEKPAKEAHTIPEWDTISYRKNSTSAPLVSPFVSNPYVERSDLAPNKNKIFAENASLKNTSPGTLESSSFQSGFHKNGLSRKTIFQPSFLPRSSNIKASGNGAMSLDKLFSRKMRMRRGLAQQETQWKEFKGKIGTGPHPIFLGVDHYFDKIRLDFNGEIAN